MNYFLGSLWLSIMYLIYRYDVLYMWCELYMIKSVNHVLISMSNHVLIIYKKDVLFMYHINEL